jgi:hypothetical protein
MAANEEESSQLWQLSEEQLAQIKWPVIQWQKRE